MWRSVPQMPVLWTRISTSLIPISGAGTSSSRSPGAASTLTRASITRAGDSPRYQLGDGAALAAGAALPDASGVPVGAGEALGGPAVGVGPGVGVGSAHCFSGLNC